MQHVLNINFFCIVFMVFCNMFVSSQSTVGLRRIRILQKRMAVSVTYTEVMQKYVDVTHSADASHTIRICRNDNSHFM